jgi:tetratricopeptide (TPR) repeat protein
MMPRSSPLPDRLPRIVLAGLGIVLALILAALGIVLAISARQGLAPADLLRSMLGPDAAPDPRGYVERGDRFFELGQYNAARDNYDAAIQADPGFADAYFARARAHEALGDPARALADYTRFLELHPADDELAATARARIEALGSEAP